MNSITDYGKIERSARIRGIVFKCVVYALLAFWAVMVLFPYYWMFLTSVKSYGSYNSEYIPKFFTLSPTLQNSFSSRFTPPVPCERIIGKNAPNCIHRA